MDNNSPLRVLYKSEALRGLLQTYGTATQVLAHWSPPKALATTALLLGLTDEEFEALLLLAERDQ